MPRLHNFEESFMNRRLIIPVLAAAIASACSAGSAKTKEQASAPAPIAAAPVAAVERPIARFIRATGTLMAEEQADVAAETAGRVVSAPVERGTPVSQGGGLIRQAEHETARRVQ